MRLLIYYLLFVSIAFPQSRHSKKMTNGKTINKELIKKGTSFFRRLLCPDGSLAKFSGVDSKMTSVGEVEDHYTIVCADGTKGKYIVNMASLPKKPKNFKLLDKDAVEKYWESRVYLKEGNKKMALKAIEEALGLEPDIKLFQDFKKELKK